MKAKILLLLLSGLGSLAPTATGQSVAPTVLATGGGTASDGKIQVAWTLGEPIIQTAGAVTQGFHSAEIQVLTSTESFAAGRLVQAFPNPVDRMLTLQFKGEKSHAALRAVVWNALAQQMLVADVAAEAAEYALDCASLAPGVYWLELHDQQGLAVAGLSFVKN